MENKYTWKPAQFRGTFLLCDGKHLARFHEREDAEQVAVLCNEALKVRKTIAWVEARMCESTGWGSRIRAVAASVANGMSLREAIAVGQGCAVPKEAAK